MASKKPKSKPKQRGRPSKKLPPVPFFGIMDEPEKTKNFNTDNPPIVEVIYDNPEMFKKIYTSFKNFSPGDIIIKFDKDRMYFYADCDENDKKVNIVFIEIFGKSLNRYYCKKPVVYQQNYLNVLKILKIKKREHNCIKLRIYKDTPLSMDVILVRGEKDIDECWSTPLITSEFLEQEATEKIIAQKENYTLHFELDWSFLHDTVVAWKLFGTEQVRLEKAGDDPLQFCFELDENKNRTIFQNDDKIKLCTKKEIDLFSLSLKIKHLIPVANAKITDTVQISADEKHKFICVALLDQKKETVIENNKKVQKIVPGSETAVITMITDIVKL